MLRYDGVLLRRLAWLGSARGPALLRRWSPGPWGALFYAALGSRRRAVRANQRRIRPTAPPAEIERATLGTFLAFARCLTDTFEATGPRPPPIGVEAVGEEHLEAASRLGRGAVMVTAHVGNWELFGRIVAKKGYPVTVAMARERNPSVRRFSEDLRAGGGVEVLYTDDGSGAFVALDLLRALRRGRMLAVQIDRPAGGDGDVVLPFFGAQVPFPRGPFLLAQAAGAPVLPVFTFLLGHHRYRVEVSPPIEVPRTGRGAVSVAAANAVRILESAVRRFPEQWFHFTEIGGSGYAAGTPATAHTPEPERQTG